MSLSDELPLNWDDGMEELYERSKAWLAWWRSIPPDGEPCPEPVWNLAGVVALMERTEEEANRESD